uniref:Uncharacterized protein n=1 Tax=Oryza nivara TaxID=4536 RepID=A0A0E0FTK0_ORYNI
MCDLDQECIDCRLSTWVKLTVQEPANGHVYPLHPATSCRGGPGTRDGEEGAVGADVDVEKDGVVAGHGSSSSKSDGGGRRRRWLTTMPRRGSQRPREQQQQPPPSPARRCRGCRRRKHALAAARPRRGRRRRPHALAAAAAPERTPLPPPALAAAAAAPRASSRRPPALAVAVAAPSAGAVAVAAPPAGAAHAAAGTVAVAARRKETSRQSSLVGSLHVKGQHTTRFQREKESVRRQQYQKYNIFWTQKLCKMAYNDIPTQNGAVLTIHKQTVTSQQTWKVLSRKDAEKLEAMASKLMEAVSSLGPPRAGVGVSTNQNRFIQIYSTKYSETKIQQSS